MWYLSYVRGIYEPIRNGFRVSDQQLKTSGSGGTVGNQTSEIEILSRKSSEDRKKTLMDGHAYVVYEFVEPLQEWKRSKGTEEFVTKLDTLKEKQRERRKELDGLSR